MKRLKWVLLWVIPAVVLVLVVIFGVFALDPFRMWLAPTPPATVVQKPPPPTFTFKMADGQLMVTHSSAGELTCSFDVECDIWNQTDQMSFRNKRIWSIENWPAGTAQHFKLPRLAKPNNCRVRPVRISGLYSVAEGGLTWAYTVDEKLDLPEWVPPDW